jgi:prepilin-type N-terminal cleavage/methylation domain-containing protein
VSERGFSLVEALCALALLGIALIGVIPTFQVLVNVDTLSEQRSNAVAAAQQVMEALRQQSPSSLPTSGASAVQHVSVGDHDYEVTAHYCTNPTFCTADMRHVVLDVSFGGRNVYIVETVYTRLQ